MAAVAWTLSVVLATLAGLHVYWALGGEWGLRAALGGHEVPHRLAIWPIALALAAGTGVVLGRYGIWDASLPASVFRYGTWTLAGAFALAAVVNLAGRTALERLGFAPFCLFLAVILAILA